MALKSSSVLVKSLWRNRASKEAMQKYIFDNANIYFTEPLTLIVKETVVYG